MQIVIIPFIFKCCVFVVWASPTAEAN